MVDIYKIRYEYVIYYYLFGLSCVIVSMLSMVLFCTTFHVYLYASGSAQRGSRRGVVEQIIMSFSLIGKRFLFIHKSHFTIYLSLVWITENVQKLGQESRDEMGLAAINGIKAISMLFIIGGHALLFMVGGPILNADFYAKVATLCWTAIPEIS